MKLKWLILAALVISLFIVPNFAYSQGMGSDGDDFIKKFIDLRNSFFIEQKEKSEKQPMENGKIVTDSFRDFVIVEYTDFKNKNGYSLYGTVFMPRKAYEDMQKGISDKKYPFVFLAYGTMCDNRIYGILFRELAKKGYIVAGIDYQGQGFSSGPAPMKGHLVDSEEMANEILEFQDYLFKNDYPIDENKMGIFGWSLGTMVTPAVVNKDLRYKAIVQMGVFYDNSENGSTSHWKKYRESIEAKGIPLLMEMTMLTFHDSIFCTPWFGPAVELFKDYKSQVELIIHDPAPESPLSFAGFMSKNRVYHFIIDDLIPFYDYFVKGDNKAYQKLIASDPYTTKVKKAYKFNADQRLLDNSDLAVINRARALNGNVHDGYWFSYYIFGPMWATMIPMLAYMDIPVEYISRLFLPWDVMWNFGIEYFEPNQEEMMIH